jgi:eukaryotic-like serine/threonine-protein kinase
MRLTAGTRLGPYSIQSALGAGGMGEVYLARDINLARDVAIKVLPEAFAHDVERLARFEREARTLAALNHPNIAIVHGLESVLIDSGHVRALVMELVDGPTLAELIGALSVPEALRLARQIAEGLEAAHEQGIIHRDLKPANIKVRPDGTVKVLDFGLAKAAEPAGAISPGLSLSPTITSPAMTAAGLILGTAAYMSPEQAKGREADKRSDVWSFGAVLYEMLTGRRAFDGDDVSDTIASVLKSEPDWSIVPADVPPAVVSLMKGCLVKDRRQRVSDMSTAKFVLTELGSLGTGGSPVASTSVGTGRSRWAQLVTIVIAALSAGALVGAVMWFSRPAPRAVNVARFSLIPEGPFTSTVQQLLAVSPDGTKIAYNAGGRLRVRALADLESRALTDGDTIALNPAFSPDGASIAFTTVLENGPALRQIPVSGGTIATVATFPGVTNLSGISWSREGILLGAGGAGILRISPDGGTPERIIAVGADEVAHRPQMLPDGQTVLFTLAKTLGDDRWDKALIVAQSLADGTRRVLIEGGSDARYIETGHLLYAVGGTMFAVPFDASTLTITGPTASAIVGVRRAVGGTNGGAHVTVSATGTLAYLPGPATTSSTGGTVLVVGDGKSEPTPLQVPAGTYAHPRVSPDGRVLAVSRSEGVGSDIWTYDLSGATEMQRLTFGGQSRFPIWSADGRRVTYQSLRDHAIWWEPVDGGTPERLTSPAENEEHTPEAWSPDGSRLLFGIRKGAMQSLWVFTLADRKTMPFGQVQSAESLSAGFSPDGRWVVYASAERAGGVQSPNRGVFVEPFPATGAKRQAPKRLLDYHPRWAPDGKGIWYVPGAARPLVLVPIRLQPSIVFGTPVEMTRAPLPGLLSLDVRGYDVLPDGRIVGISSVNGTGAAAFPLEFRVVLNWFEELKRLAPK